MALNLPTVSKRLKRLVVVLAVLGAYVVTTSLLAQRYSAIPAARGQRADIRGAWFYRNDEKYLIKAVGYDPTRPGELPWTRKQPASLVDSDFARIRAAGFNTIRTWEVLSRDDLDAAARRGLSVIQGIWIDPDGHFSDPAFQRDAIDKVVRSVRNCRGKPAIIAYLVMNEPKPARVLAEGVEPTRAFLRLLANAVRAEDPGVPVGFAAWAGLEFLDEPTFDFAAVNLYPVRPAVLEQTIGYEGMVRLWKTRSASQRPLLISEYGLSVSPNKPKVNDSGGLTEAEQAAQLPQLADQLMRGGAAGGAVFMWIDGWWKNNDVPHDEMTHDPNDGEEWFGLVAMDALGDVQGRPRPALAAMQAWNRTVLTLPADGPVSAREVEFEANVEDSGDIRAEVALDDGEAQELPTVRDGSWLRGRFGLLSRVHGPQRVVFTLTNSRGESWRFTRLLIPPGEGPSLRLESTGSGPSRAVLLTARDAGGQPLARTAIRVAVSEASHQYDQALRLTTDAAGRISLPLQLPGYAAVFQVAASLWDNDTLLAVNSLLLYSEVHP